MSDRWIDPTNLKGDALVKWFTQTADEKERARREAAAKCYQAYFRPMTMQDLSGQSTAGSKVVPTRRAGSVPGTNRLILTPKKATAPQAEQVRAPSPSLDLTQSTKGMAQPIPPIAYGALRAPAPAPEEISDLRREQASFGETTREIGRKNSWFAVPALAPPLAILGLEAAAAWTLSRALPVTKPAPFQLTGRDPYLRVGDNWATRAGRRAHGELRAKVDAKPNWDNEPSLARPGKRALRPDVGAPRRDPTDLQKRKLLELKPDTPSGRAAGQRALKKYREVTDNPIRIIYYKLKDFL